MLICDLFLIVSGVYNIICIGDSEIVGTSKGFKIVLHTYDE